MKIKPAAWHSFGDFKLDLSKIDISSREKSNILLPYYGVLPRGLAVKSAAIYLNIQPFQRPKQIVAVLDINLINLTPKRFVLDCTNDEVLDILRRFFDNDAPGLDAYWRGVWQAHFIDWRASCDITRITDLLTTLSSEDRKRIFNSILLFEEDNKPT